MTTLAAPGRPVTSRSALTMLLLVLAALLLAYRDTLVAMVSIWARSDTFAHAFLVPPIVLWLIWRRREALARARPDPDLRMLLPMAGVALVWLLGDLTSMNSATQFAMVGMLVLAVPVVLGFAVTRQIAFPLAFLFFAVPIGDFLLPQLMTWTADFTASALRLSGIPVFREGTQIVIPSGHWSVVEACSGVRYLIASLMVGTLFAYLNYRSTWRRWAFVGISIAVPIVANWIRAFSIVLVGHLSDNRLAVGVDHLIYGWLFFGVVIALMFAIGSLWREDDHIPVQSRHTDPAAGSRSGSASRPALAIAASVACVIVLAPHAALYAIGDVEPGPAPRLVARDRLSEGWRAEPNSVPAWKPSFKNPSAEASALYTSGQQRVGLYIGYYRQQDYRRKLVSSENELVQSLDPDWTRLGRSERIGIEIDGGPLAFDSTLIRGAPDARSPQRQLRVWRTYWVGGRLTPSEGWAKVYAATDRLFGRGDDAAVIVLYAEDGDRPHGSRAALESFARANLGIIVGQLRDTRDAIRASIVAGTFGSRGRQE